MLGRGFLLYGRGHKAIEVIQGAFYFPVILDNSRIISNYTLCMSDGHFESMITNTHNTFYNSQVDGSSYC